MKSVNVNEYSILIETQEKIELKKACELIGCSEAKLPEQTKVKCLKFAQNEVAISYKIKDVNLNAFSEEDRKAHAGAKKLLQVKNKGITSWRKTWIAERDDNGDLTGYEVELQFGMYCNKSGKAREGKNAELRAILKEAKKAQEEAEEVSEEK